jgi:23S rRNA pseudouridine1911/1915/1917 synthase
VEKKAVPPFLAGQALDKVVRKLFDVSWNEARARIERGKIAIDGAVTTDPRTAVAEGAALVYTENARRPRPETDLPAGSIVHVDPHVIVVRKPPNVSTVPFDEHETGTLDARIRAYLERDARAHGARPKTGTKEERAGRPSLGVVHRIDKETSGLVVFTRTWLAKQSLSMQFRKHTVKRRYLAIVHGHPRAGTIRSHLVADRGDGLRGSLEARGLRGKEQAQLAITHVEVEEKLEGAALVSCRLETGRTHQIRIHLAESGHPLVGERVYIRDYKGERIEAPRLMLHATELGFIHPASEREMLFTDEMPEDMKAVQERLRATGI